MESTTTTPGATGVIESLAQALRDFAVGISSLSEIRRALADSMCSDSADVAQIRRLLKEELAARRLSAGDFTELMSEVDKLEHEPRPTAVRQAGKTRPAAPASGAQEVSIDTSFIDTMNLDFDLGDIDADADNLSESIATETDEAVPDQSGIYRMDHEGTLVLSEEESNLEDVHESLDQDEAETSRIGQGAVLRGRFRLDQEVARGSMGIVYKAVDLMKVDSGAKDPIIAVKLISPEFVSHKTALRSFQNEIANTQHLSHPNIIRLFELDRDEDNYFITMEWLEGEALDVLLDRSQGSALPPVQAYAIIEQLCDALVYAHGRGVIHADIKPGNVFLIETGELKLIDFGIARIGAELDEAGEGNGMGVALTPAYASAECLEREIPTEQDDLYSLACMIYRLLSGRRVFGAKHALDAESEGLEPVRIGGMSDSRWNTLRKALSFRRADRQQSIKEFAEAFGQRSEQREEPANVEVADEVHTETSVIEALPEEFLIDDGLLNEELNETAELTALAGHNQMVDQEEEPTPVNDTTHIEALNETKELHSLAGIEDVEQRAKQQDAPEIDESLIELALVAETAKVKAQPNFAIHAGAGQELDLDLTEGEEEVPFVDTVNMGDSAPVDPDPASKISVPTDETAPAKPVPAAKSKPSKRSGPKARKVEQPAEQAVSPRSAEQVRNQLRGANARNNGAGTLTEKLRAHATHIAIAAGVVIAVMIGAGVMLSLNQTTTEQPRVAAVTQPQATNARPAGVAAPPVTRADSPAAAVSESLANDDFAPAIAPVAPKEPNPAPAKSVAAAPPIPARAAAAPPLPAAAPPLPAEAPALPAETPSLPAGAAPVPAGAPPLPAGAPPVASAKPDTAFGAVVADSDYLLDGNDAATRSGIAAVDQVAPDAPIRPLSSSGKPLESAETPAAAPVAPEIIDSLVRKTSLALSNGRLLQPEEDSALYWLNQLRTADPLNPALNRLSADLGRAMIDKAESAYIEGDLGTASKWADAAEAAGASEVDLTPVRRSIEKSRR